VLGCVVARGYREAEGGGVLVDALEHRREHCAQSDGTQSTRATINQTRSTQATQSDA
jgi:hypothetical protein